MVMYKFYFLLQQQAVGCPGGYWMWAPVVVGIKFYFCWSAQYGLFTSTWLRLEDSSLLGCDAVSSGTTCPTHSFTSQKMWIFTSTTVKT
jgi:hypothetical protein